MRLRSRIDGKIYRVWTFETYTDAIGLEYMTEDGSPSELIGIGVNGGRTSYGSLAQIHRYWADPDEA